MKGQMLQLWVLVLLTLLGSSPPANAVDPTVPKDRPVTDKWALIVGVSKFQQRTLPQLRYAAKDARDFRDFLVNKANFAPDHVRLLLDEKATRKQILSGFDKFLGRVARKDDLVVVYFSTHGSPESSDARGKSYLISYDADKEDLFASAIPMSDITDLVRERITSDRVLLVMDTCFSGASVNAGAKSVEEVGNIDAAKIAQGSGQLVICSSSPKERSWESRRYSNGVFTKKLIDSLCVKGPQTKLGAAFCTISEDVENEVREDQGIRQRPVLATAGWKGEDLMLGAPPAAPRPIPDVVKELLDPDSTAVAETGYDRSIVRTVEPSLPSVTAPAQTPPAPITPSPTSIPLPDPTLPSAGAANAAKATEASAKNSSQPSSATIKNDSRTSTPVKAKPPGIKNRFPNAAAPVGEATAKEKRPSKPPPPVAPLWTRQDAGR